MSVEVEVINVKRERSQLDMVEASMPPLSRGYSFISGTMSDSKLPLNRAPSMRFDAGLKDLEKQIAPVIPENCPAGAKATVVSTSNPVYDYHQIKDCKYGSSRDVNQRAGSVILRLSSPSVLDSSKRRVVADNWQIALQEREAKKANAANNASLITSSIESIKEEPNENIDKPNISKIGSKKSNDLKPVDKVKTFTTKAGICKKFGTRSVYSSNLDILVAQITSSPYTIKPMAPYTDDYLRKAKDILELKFSAERLNNSHVEDSIISRSVMLKQVKAAVPKYSPHLKQDGKHVHKVMNRADNEEDLLQALHYIEEIGTHMIHPQQQQNSSENLIGGFQRGNSYANSVPSRTSPALKKGDTSNSLDVSGSDTIAPLPTFAAKLEPIGIAHKDMGDNSQVSESNTPLVHLSSGVSPAMSRKGSHMLLRVPDGNVTPVRASRRESLRMLVDTISDLAADCVHAVDKLNDEVEQKRLMATKSMTSSNGSYSKDSGGSLASDTLVSRKSMIRLKSAPPAQDSSNEGILIASKEFSEGVDMMKLSRPNSALPSLVQQDDTNSNYQLEGSIESSVELNRKNKKKMLENQFANILNYSTAYQRSKFTEFKPLKRKAKTPKEIQEIKQEKLESAMNSRANSIAMMKQKSIMGGSMVIEQVKPMESIMEALGNVRDEFKEEMETDKVEKMEKIKQPRPSSSPAERKQREKSLPEDETKYSNEDIRRCLVDILSSHTKDSSAKLLHNNNINMTCTRPVSANNGGIIPHSSPVRFYNPNIKSANKYKEMHTAGIFVDHRRQGWGLDYSKNLYRNVIDGHANVNDWNSYKSVLEERQEIHK